ncbi:MAG: hypothetical protein AB2417_15795 [Clostridiaceae bacterium]
MRNLSIDFTEQELRNLLIFLDRAEIKGKEEAFVYVNLWSLLERPNIKYNTDKEEETDKQQSKDKK